MCFAAVEGRRLGQAERRAVDRAKQERDAATDALKVTVLETVGPQFEGREGEIGAAYRSLTKKLVRQRILTDHFRIDGRGITDIRSLSAEIGIIPRAHGSALFERARRDPDPGCHHAGHGQAGAADRLAGPGEDQALHAPLQLPAVLDR